MAEYHSRLRTRAYMAMLAALIIVMAFAFHPVANLLAASSLLPCILSHDHATANLLHFFPHKARDYTFNISLLTPRDEISDGQWETLIAKGNNFQCYFPMSAAELTKAMGRESQSKWKYEDVKKYGWVDEPCNWNMDFSNSIPITQAMKAVGLSTEVPTGDWTPFGMVYVEQENQVTVDGVKYEPSNGFFQNVFDVKKGAIIAWGNYGPAFKMREKYPNASQLPPIPPLKQMSDLWFLEYQHTADLNNVKDLKTLKHVFRVLISNEQTKAIVKRALNGRPLKPWPGDGFGSDTEAFKAILGSPNGGGTAWLLLNHKAEFGIKEIYQVTVFLQDIKEGNQNPAPNILFWIKDVDQGQQSRRSYLP